MIGKLFTKQIVCGVATALGFSGSVYFVLKKTVPTTSTVTITKTITQQEDGMDGYTPAAALIKQVDLDVIDTVFQLLNKMQEGG